MLRVLNRGPFELTLERIASNIVWQVSWNDSGHSPTAAVVVVEVAVVNSSHFEERFGRGIGSKLGGRRDGENAHYNSVTSREALKVFRLIQARRQSLSS